MTEPGVVALVGSLLTLLGVITTALSAIMVARITSMKRDVAMVKHEVKNDHTTNLRVEQDERHGENSEKLDYLVGAVAWLIRMAVNNRTDITELQEHTGQGRSRRSRRLAQQRPPIDQDSIPKPFDERNPS